MTALYIIDENEFQVHAPEYDDFLAECEKKLNSEFDFNIVISPEHQPTYHNGDDLVISKSLHDKMTPLQFKAYLA